MKRKLLLAAMFVAGALGVNLQAQEQDYTDRITNANMASKDGWTLTQTTTDPNNVWSAIKGSSPSYCIEAYAGWGSLTMTEYAIKQNVTLPSGKYRAEGYAFYRYGLQAETDPSKSYAFLVAGDFKEKVVTLGGETLDETLTAFPNSMDEASQAFTDGYYKSTIEFSVETESDIEFGYEGTHPLKQSWFICGPIKLYRTGDFDYSLYITKLSNKIGEAEALYDADIPGAAKTALKAAVDAIKTRTCSTVTEYNTACDDIDAAIATYASQEIQTAYTKWLDMKTMAETLAAAENDNAEANGTLSQAITDQQTAADAATAVADIDEAIAALKAAMITYAGVAKPTNPEQPFNLTFMMVNPDLTGLPAWQQCDGWTTEQTDGNYQVMTNDNATSADGSKTFFYEYWSFEAKKNDKFNLYNAVTLSEGTFKMTCYAFAKQQDGEAGKTPVEGVYFYANDTQGGCVSDSRLTQKEISFVNDKEQEVKIGLKALSSGNTYNWMGIGYVELYKVPDDNTQYAIDVNENSDVTGVQVTGDGVDEYGESSLSLKTVTVTVATKDNYYVSNVTVTYTEGEAVKNVDVAKIEDGVYSFQMPKFDVTVNVETKEFDHVAMTIVPAVQYATFVAPFEVKIPEGVRAWVVTGVNEADQTLVWDEQEEAIAANTPVVLYSESAVEETFDGVGAFPTAKEDGSVIATVGLLTGVLKVSPTTGGYEVPTGSYVLQDQEDAEGVGFYPTATNSPIFLEAGKAFLTVPAEVGDAGIKGFFFPVEGEATAIAAMKVLTTGYEGIYNAAGVKVNSLQKGLNIVKKSGKSYKIYVK